MILKLKAIKITAVENDFKQNLADDFLLLYF